jgi:hypothetical protein
LRAPPRLALEREVFLDEAFFAAFFAAAMVISPELEWIAHKPPVGLGAERPHGGRVVRPRGPLTRPQRGS